MRLIRAVVLALGLGLPAIPAAAASLPVDPDGYLRVFHGVQAAAALPLNVAFDGRPAGDVPWGGATAWQRRTPGRHQVTVAGLPGTRPAVVTVSIKAGCRTTIFAGQPDSAVARVRLVPHRDCTRTRIPPESVRITTVFAANPDFGPVEFRTASQSQPLSIIPYRPTRSLTIPAGEAHLTIGAVGTTERFATASITLAAGNAFTIAWVGGGERAASTLLILRDATQAPKAPPPASNQPINTGLDDQGYGPRAWMAALAVFAAATVTLTRRSVRLRMLLLSFLLGAAVGCTSQAGADGNTQPPITSAPAPAPASNIKPSRQPPAIDGGAAPARLQIETLHLDHAVVAFSMKELVGLPGTLATGEVAWLSSSSPAGAPGTTALLGHSTFSANGAFASLPSIRPGDRIQLTDTTGRRHSYVVRSALTFPKQEFPAEIWAPQPVPFLALITCDGPRDPVTGLHSHNLMVWATAGP